MMHIGTTLLFVASVSAHGYVSWGVLGTNNATFYQPYSDPYMNPKVPRISRPIQGNGPVQDVTLADIQCGGYTAGGVVGSQPAALHADVTAGAQVELGWTLWPESHVGPVITYMAQCPSTGCQNYMPNTDAVWFKIKEEGRQGTSNTWGSTPLMKAGGVATYTVPKCIKSGYYLVRHETIALHASSTYPGAQFYPGCHQIKVSGGGNTNPTGLVSFPGAYKSTDPGITYDAYKAQTYTIPGPKVFTC